MTNKLNLNWLENISIEKNQFILNEYRYLVHRFTQWMGLTISKTQNETVRQLILPNFVEESGTIEGTKSHLKMLDNLFLSTGIKDYLNYKPTKKTKKIEESFYNTFDSNNTYKSLCVLGPSTEALSEQFLIPLMSVTLKHFPNADREYFEIHLSELEDEHAISIDKAIADMELKDNSLQKNKSEFIEFGFDLHKQFWTNLENN